MDKEYQSTIITFNPDGTHEKIAFNGNEDLPKMIKSEKWVKIDGWRGYTDWEITEGYTEIADGWVTGFPDKSVERKIELSEMFEDLLEGKVTPPCPLYWLFGITSNVFSTASAIIIKKENEKILADWLDKINGGVEGLREMLA